MIIKKSDVLKASSKSSFSTYDSMLVKGVAIILLMFHHCIMATGVKGYDINYFPFTSSHYPILICDTFKLCVGMFVFITGYGLYKSICNIEFNSRSVFNWTGTRLVKALSGFWVVYVLVFITTYLVDRLPYRVYVSAPTKMDGSWLYAILDFLGVAHIFETPMLVGTWWYMSALVVMIVFFPLIFKISERFGYVVMGLMIILLPRVANIGFPGTKNIFSFALAYVLGMAFAKYNLFEKQMNINPFKKYKVIWDILLFFVYIILFGLIVYITQRLGRKYLWEFNYCIAPVIVILFCNRYFRRIPILNYALMYIGSHSLNIFLIHTFIRWVYLKDFIYSFKYAILIPFVLLAITLAISIFVELLKRLVGYDKLVSKLIKRIF